MHREAAAGGPRRGPAPEPRAVRACLFDLDGTLVDSEPNFDLTERAFLGSFGIEYSAELRRRVLGRGMAAFFSTLEELYPDNPLNALPLAERMRIHHERYLDLARGRTRAFPALAGLVRALAARGLPMAVASGSSPGIIDWALGEAGLAELLPLRVSAEEVPAGKPAPDIFLEAARRLGAEPATCLVFEDALPGLLAAKAAGMRCVLLPEPGFAHPEFGLADLLVEGGPDATTAAALLAYLDSL